MGIALALVVLIGGYWIWSAVQQSQQSPDSGLISKENPANSGTLLIEIKGRAFIASTATVSAGTTVIWKNYDDVLHSVVGQNFQSGPLKKGESYSHIFTQPGTYAYYDGIQPATKGQIIVK